MNQLKKLSAASKIAIFYALIGGCWIFFSDWILAGLVKDERQLTFCQNYKGWGFVGITALSLYWILSCYLSQLKSSQLNGIKFSTLVESANDAIFLMKGDKFVDCNSKTIAIFGLKNKEDIIGKTPYFFSPERQPNGRLSKEKAGELISAVQKGIPQFFEWQHLKADQTPFYTEVSLNRLPPPHEELIIAIVRDITERKKAEEEIRKLNEELEHRVRIKTKELELKNRQLQENQQILLKLIKELNLKTEAIQQANSRLQELDRLKSMFIASMSHELRTPLNSIIGFSSILLEEWAGSLNPEQKENLSIVLNSGKHLLALINDIIDISKIEAGLVEADITNFDLYDLITEASNLIAPEMEKKKLEFRWSGVHQEMHTDRRRLLQCILNLLSNALKFTEKGKITLEIKPVLFRQSFLAISVQDTGIGIKEEDVSQLFQPFVRLKSPLKNKTLGTGLGLYLTKKIVTEILKGEIEVTSKPDEGSVFTLKIPVRI